eukprot:7335042-Alexandrium_andersonii.AAC.1
MNAASPTCTHADPSTSRHTSVSCKLLSQTPEQQLVLSSACRHREGSSAEGREDPRSISMIVEASS